MKSPTWAVSGGGVPWVPHCRHSRWVTPVSVLTPIVGLEAWLGLEWDIPTPLSHRLWGSSGCRTRPQVGEGRGLEQGSGDTGVRVQGPTGSTTRTGSL